MNTLTVESAVKDRYAAAARKTEAALCCPISYNQDFLKIIPPEVLAKDYGCGDPSRHVHAGETVLDLGSGAGKICFIAAQVVGPAGRVIGVDMTDAMLEVARRNAPLVADRLGYANVEFRKGRIQDLALDLDALDRELKAHPITDANSFLAADELARELRVTAPLVRDDSIDVVVSNCVLNLVEPSAKRQLFNEIFRVLRKGGRAVISDITSDEDVPAEMQCDAELWSGCIAGALREDLFLRAFEDAGFYGIRILERAEQPWSTIRGIEFRSLTVEAFKGKQGPCFERRQAVLYKGPFKEVLDDDGHRLARGQRYAVCDKTYQLYKQPPYRDHFEFIDPLVSVPLEEAEPFHCSGLRLRHPKETKGQDYDATTEPSRCCDGGPCE
ncbi:MAG: methyltransferase domain-containing protein [Verrucomicrobia bacterium]|nr:methyltransferase domain-containing protein [Verrucomicrobiota bacterium]